MPRKSLCLRTAATASAQPPARAALSGDGGAFRNTYPTKKIPAKRLAGIISYQILLCSFFLSVKIRIRAFVCFLALFLER